MVRRSDYRIPDELSSHVALTEDDHTSAYYVFRRNVTALDGIIATMTPTASLDNDWLYPRRRAELEDRITELNEVFFAVPGDSLDALMRRWLVVMRVTTTEVYLKDALTTLALFGQPSPAREASITWSYKEVVGLSESKSPLVSFCSDWAKGVIDDRGGPPLWCKRLIGFGCAEVANVDVKYLDTMWGVRHIQVHRSGKADAEFERRHQTFPVKNGMVEVDANAIEHLWKATDSLVDATERGIAGHLKAVMGDLAYSAYRAEHEEYYHELAAAYESDQDGLADMLDMQAHNQIREAGYQE